MYKEFVLPLGIAAILGSMLLPLPPVLIDFLLVGNLAFALILLLSALYISDPLKLSCLPSVLLLAVLYRLALNVSTTRLILGAGEGGRLIEAFGSVVVQGNLLVGAVVFLVITLVQFIVIAKGSERVAEVSARFTLDALPGKQMSIDADVRAGLIDFQSAREKRQELQIESRFYGALDGAMKFVKGDALAGMIITAINVAGGLLSGILIAGLDFQMALSKYTLLTVGDGLLSQIPALLNSLAAGLVVTRVVRGDGAALSTEILSQLGQNHRVTVFVGIFALVFTLMPGMPVIPFLCLSIVCLGLAFAGRNKSADSSRSVENFKPKTPSLLKVECGRTLCKELASPGSLSGLLRDFQENVYDNCGLVLPPPEISAESSLDAEFRILMRGVEVAVYTESLAEDSGVSSLKNKLLEIVLSGPEEFVDDILTRRTLDYFDEVAPELVSSVVPGLISLTRLSTILKELCREGISIKHIDIILQALAESAQAVNNERELLEAVRIALKRVISHRFAGPDKTIRAFTLDPLIDLAFVKVEKEGQVLCPDYIDLIEIQLKQARADRPLLLVSRGARKIIQECLDLRGMKVTVLAMEEVADDMGFESCGSIEIERNELKEAAVEQIAA